MCCRTIFICVGSEESVSLIVLTDHHGQSYSQDRMNAWIQLIAYTYTVQPSLFSPQYIINTCNVLVHYSSNVLLWKYVTLRCNMIIWLIIIIFLRQSNHAQIKFHLSGSWAFDVWWMWTCWPLLNDIPGVRNIIWNLFPGLVRPKRCATTSGSNLEKSYRPKMRKKWTVI